MFFLKQKKINKNIFNYYNIIIYIFIKKKSIYNLISNMSSENLNYSFLHINLKLNPDSEILKNKSEIPSKKKTKKKFKIHKIQCLHGCNHAFKTRRQKVLHHNKLDVECSQEKLNLLILLEKFQKTINQLLKFPNEKFTYRQFKRLIKQYNYTKTKVLDRDQFVVMLY